MIFAYFHCNVTHEIKDASVVEMMQWFNESTFKHIRTQQGILVGKRQI